MSERRFLAHEDDTAAPDTPLFDDDPESPPWSCGDCGYSGNQDGACDWCGQLWEFS